MQIKELFGRFRILKRLDLIEAIERKLMTDFSKLSAVADKLAVDFAALSADVKAYIAANPPANPAEQAVVDGIVAKLNTLDSGLADLDSATKPPAGGGTA